MFLRLAGFQFKRRLAVGSRQSMSTAPKKPVLALPETAEETVNIGINDTYRLKDLGPVGKKKKTN
jgi:hypothetical protein